MILRSPLPPKILGQKAKSNLSGDSSEPPNIYFFTRQGVQATSNTLKIISVKATPIVDYNSKAKKPL